MKGCGSFFESAHLFLVVHMKFFVKAGMEFPNAEKLFSLPGMSCVYIYWLIVITYSSQTAVL